MPGRVAYLDDPVFGNLEPVAAVRSGGRLTVGTDRREEPVPVVCFEPESALVSENKVTGLLQQIRIESLTRTDVDLMDLAEGERGSWIGGVHFAEGLHPAWMRAVRRRRLALLVTGPKMPDGSGISDMHPLDRLDELWAALVPVIFA